MDVFEIRGPLDLWVVWPRPRDTVYVLNGCLFTPGSVWTSVVYDDVFRLQSGRDST